MSTLDVRAIARRRGLPLLATALAIVMAASASPLLAADGTISGKVQAMPEKYLDETVVYVKQAQGTFPPRTLEMDQKGKMFIPHVLVVTKGDTVKYLNHDTIAHNVFSPDHETFNLGTFKPGEVRTYTYDKATGAYTQLCSIHPEMLAYVFVNQNPYAAAVNKEGRFTIKDVPAGTYELEVWNSHLKAPPKRITVTAGTTTEANFSIHR